MKKLFKLALLFLATVLVIEPFFIDIPKAKAISYSPEVYKTGYYNNLITDEEFTNINSMTMGDIQNFLINNGSYLQYFQEGGKYAAQIIWEAAHAMTPQSSTASHFDGDWGTPLINLSTGGTVNPLVILVTLQKEQSLITRTTQSEYALTWAMGYGCLENGTRNPNLAGFTNQVGWGAWQLKYNWYRAQGYGASNYQVGQTMSFSDWTGNYNVTFANRATASLYRYTPHAFNGNFNFWRMFNDNRQLGAAAINPYVKKPDPIGVLTGNLVVKKDEANPVNYYLVLSGSKYMLKDAQSIIDWGIVSTSITDLITNETAGANVGNLVKLAGADAYYRIDAGKRQFFETNDALLTYGYVASDAVVLPKEILETLVKGENLGQIVSRIGNETIYYLDVAKVAYPFVSKAVFLNAGLKDDNIRMISETDFAKLTLGEAINTAGKTSDSPVYLLVNGYKRLYASADDLARSGHGVSNSSPSSFLALFTPGPNVSFPAFVPPPAPVVVAPVVAVLTAPAPEVRYKYVTQCSYKTVNRKRKRICAKVKVPMKLVTLYKYQYKKTCLVKKVKGKNRNVCTTKKVKVPYTVWR